MRIVNCFMYMGVAVVITDTGYLWVAYNQGGEMRFACCRNLQEVDEIARRG
jgi:hypothetical protein